MAKYVKVSIRMPKNLEQIINVLGNQAVGEVIRSALRSASAAGTRSLKALTKSELMESEQSTGATERAVTNKVGRSKANPYKFYAIIGIDKSVIESHSFSKPDGAVTKLRKGKQRGIGLFGVRQRKIGKTKSIAGMRDAKGMPVKGTKVRSRQVFSRWRNSPFKKKLKSKGFIRRKPSRYFHLINDGFLNVYSKARTVAYDFIERTTASSQGAMQGIFVSKIVSKLPEVVAKEISRNVDRANKTIRNH